MANMDRILDWYGLGMMRRTGAGVDTPDGPQSDGPTMDLTSGPVDSNGLTFEQALQQVGLLDEWLEYKATQQGQ